MERRLPGIKIYFSVFQVFLLVCISLVLFLLVCCRPPQVLILSETSRIDSIEGFASIRISNNKGSARSRFSFLFQLPYQGRIEVYNLLGKTLYTIIINKEKAVFVLPSEKVYWQGEEEEVIYNFLGFRLTLYEIMSILSGKWEKGGERIRKENFLKSWILEENERGRIIAGEREDFRFEVKELFAKTPFARLLTFQHPLSKGRLKVLRINVNQPIKKEAFSLFFLKKYERKSWAEIEKLLADEN